LVVAVIDSYAGEARAPNHRHDRISSEHLR